MEMNDFLTMKAMDSGLSPYEQYKVGYLQQKNHVTSLGRPLCWITTSS